MPNAKLYINNQLCDLAGDESIEVDYSIFDITKIGSRGGARSYEFNLPKTNRNKSILENPEIVNNISHVPYTRLPALVLVDGVDVLIRFAEVATAKDVYEIRLYGSNSDLFSILASHKLFELDLGDLDEIWTRSTMVNARSRTEGLIYPVVDYQEDSPNSFINNDNRTVKAAGLPPCIFVNDLLQRIFDFINYDYTNQVEDDFELIMPLINFNPPNDVISNLLNKKYAGIFGMYAAQTINYVTSLNAAQVFAFDYVSSYAGSYYVLPYADFYGNRSVRIVDSLIFDVTFTFDITFSSANPGNPTRNTVSFYVQMWSENGQPFFVQPGYIKTFNNQRDGLVTLTWTQQFDIFNFPGGYKNFDFEVKIWNGDLIFQEPFTVENTSKVEFSNIRYIDEILRYDQNFNTSLLLPDMTMADFVKNYLLMFGLLPVLGADGHSVGLVRFDILLANISKAYDWSNLLDFSEDAEVKFILDKYGQNNLLNWTKDGKEIQPNGTNGNIQVDNKNLELEKEIFTLDFASSNYVTRIVDNIVSQIPLMKSGQITNALSPRMLYLQRKTDVDIGGSMVYSDDAGDTAFNDNIGFGYFLNPLNANNMGFGNNLMANYYQLLISILSGVKVITVQVRLSHAQISMLDFSIPVWIQKFEAYFYISAIKGFSYTENKSTQVELVKLNING